MHSRGLGSENAVPWWALLLRLVYLWWFFFSYLWLEFAYCRSVGVWRCSCGGFLEQIVFASRMKLDRVTTSYQTHRDEGRTVEKDRRHRSSLAPVCVLFFDVTSQWAIVMTYQKNLSRILWRVRNVIIFYLSPSSCWFLFILVRFFGRLISLLLESWVKEPRRWKTMGKHLK